MLIFRVERTAYIGICFSVFTFFGGTKIMRFTSMCCTVKMCETTSIKNAFPFVVSILLLVTSFFSTGEVVIEKLEVAKKDFQERQYQRLEILMSAEKLYPNEDVRRLALAAGDGDLKSIDALVNAGVDVNEALVNNVTALFWPLRKSNYLGFEKLLAEGASPNFIFSYTGSIMGWAAKQGEIRFLKTALNYGGDPNTITNDTSLLNEVIIHGKTHLKMDAVKLLVSAGADIDLSGTNGVSPILQAAYMSRYDIVCWLLEQGADPEKKNFRGENLIMEMDHTETILLPDAQQRDGIKRVRKLLNKLNKK